MADWTDSRDRPAECLNSWKEIAVYLGRETRTIQRWEKEEGLPIHRHLHNKRSSVYAIPQELDEWWRNRRASLPSQEPTEPLTPAGAHRRHAYTSLLWVGAAVTVGVLGAIFYYSSRSEVKQDALTAVSLTSYPGHEVAPALSPDGDQVAFAWNGDDRANLDIYIKQVGSYNPHRLSSNPSYEYAPAWSPDGRSVAFLRDLGNGQLAVMLIPSIGGPETQVTEIAAPHQAFGLVPPPLSSLAWSPDGKWLVVSDRHAIDEPFGLVAVSVQNGERRALTAPAKPSAGDFVPAFSPDGSMIAFCRSPAVEVSDIYMMSLSKGFQPDGQPRRLTDTGSWSTHPAWTSDARDVIYASGDYFKRQLFRVAVSGVSTPKRLAFVGEHGTAPTISTRGNRLAFVRTSADSELYRVPISPREGDPPVPEIVISSTGAEYLPDYSPSGNRIAFNSDRSGYGDIWISESDGSNPVQFTFFGAKLAGTPHWSPDGSQVVFDSRSDGAGDIWVMSAKLKAPARRLTDDAASDLVPNWSRDGRWIYFASNRSGEYASNRSGEYQVWKIPSSGGKAIQVTRQGGAHAVESVDGETLYYSKSLLAHGSGGLSLWQVPAGGVEETKVLGSLSGYADFVVTDRGIYFVPATWGGIAKPVIQFYDFGSRTARTIARLEKPLALGLAISPDAKFLLYAQVDHENSDLMLVDGFR